MTGARIALAAACVAAIVGLRAADPAPSILPLFNVPQGMSYYEVEDRPIFLRRQGSILTAYLGKSTAQGGASIVWCPREQVFVSPADRSMWTVGGATVGGPAKRDLTQVGVRVDVGLVVTIDPKDATIAPERTDGEVPGIIGDAYARFRAGDGFVRFCQDPLPPVPELVPTPTP